MIAEVFTVDVIVAVVSIGAGFTSMRFTGIMGLLPGKMVTVVVKNNRRLGNCRRPHRYRPRLRPVGSPIRIIK